MVWKNLVKKLVGFHCALGVTFWKQVETHRTSWNGPKFNWFSVLHHWNGNPQLRTKICNWYKPWPGGRVFANGLRDLGSIPRCVIPKTLKIVLDAALFNTQYYKEWITLSDIRYVSMVKWSNLGKGVAPPTPRCSSYWKGSLRVALDYSRQLYYRPKHLCLQHPTQLLELRHRFFQRLRPRNHSHFCLSTKRFISS